MKPKKGATNSPTFFIISKDTNQVKRKLSEKHPQGLGNLDYCCMSNRHNWARFGFELEELSLTKYFLDND